MENNLKLSINRRLREEARIRAVHEPEFSEAEWYELIQSDPVEMATLREEVEDEYYGID